MKTQAQTQTYKPITAAQIKKLDELFFQSGYDMNIRDCRLDRENFISVITNGNASKVEYLSYNEAEKMIGTLLWRIEQNLIPKKETQNSVMQAPKSTKMETYTHKPITTAQIKKIHVLLNQKGLMDEKETMVYSASERRTTSTKELTCHEAKALIDFMENDSKEIANLKQKNYKAIWHIAWEMGIIYGETDDDYQMNRAKLNMFCRQRGTVKKNLSEMNLIELKSTHKQFEAMYKKHLNSKKTINK